MRDLKLTPLVFDVLQLRQTQPEALALLEQLDVIHRHQKQLAKEADPEREDED